MRKGDAVRRFDAFRSFEIDEMVERRAIQTMEFDDDARGVIAARDRKIRAALKCGAPPIAEVRLATIVRCDISSIATSTIARRQDFSSASLRRQG